jgi:tetratricopeptide (TPR) repeat protein
VNRCDEAVAEEQRAMLEEPGFAQYQSGMGEVYANCRRFDDAIREFATTLPLVRDSANIFIHMGDAFFHQRRYATALAMYRKSGRVPGWAYVPLGSRREALAQLDTLKARRDHGAGSGGVLFAAALLYTSLGKHAEALTLLEQLYEAHDGVLVYLKVHPHLDPLRGEPRFQALLRKVGLAE